VSCPPAYGELADDDGIQVQITEQAVVFVDDFDGQFGTGSYEAADDVKRLEA